LEIRVGVVVLDLMALVMARCVDVHPGRPLPMGRLGTSRRRHDGTESDKSNKKRFHGSSPVSRYSAEGFHLLNSLTMRSTPARCFSDLARNGAILRISNEANVAFRTGLGDIPMAVKAMKAGANDFLNQQARLLILYASNFDQLGKNDVKPIAERHFSS
jgi:hypothetical protein